MTDLDLEIAEAVSRYYADPLGFVMFAYPWATDKSIQVCPLPKQHSLTYDSEFGPDAWACDFLLELGAEVRSRAFDGHSAVPPIKRSVVSGHGIGKSAMCAWLVDWLMSTRPDAIGTVTANTAEQLSTKTWAQIAKWTSMCITGHWFEISTGKGAMRMVNKHRPATWFCTAQTCREEKSEAFAGQHAPTSTSFYVFDEASAVPDIINEVSEGGLTDGEPMKFAFGNGTRNTGWFKGTFSSKYWHNTHVDSRSVHITNKQQIAAWIAEHGIDSDYIKARVRGLFPAQSMRQFISEADVDKAVARGLTIKPHEYQWAPKILTLDNAWTGDDEGVIALRQGLHFQILRTFAKNDNDVWVANELARLEDEHQADAVFVDAGYGTGVVSVGRTLRRDWVLVWFAEKPNDPGYLNKRAEMWGLSRDWLKQGGAIEDDPVLRRDLTGPETVPRMDGKIQLESKEDMRKRKQPSPGRGDSLALSFAHPVKVDIKRKLRQEAGVVAPQDHNTGEYNPHDVLREAA